MSCFFIDSSVFFAACCSSHGRARDMFTAAARGDVVLVASQYVLDETRLVLEEKAPRALPFLDQMIAALPLEIVEPTRKQVLAAATLKTLRDPADAPIVAAAKKAQVDLVVSSDRKHLVGQPELARYMQAQIVLPQQAWEQLRSGSL